MTREQASREHGYAMAALLVALAVMGIVLSMALPVWRTAVRREREAELVFRGGQYVQAIELFSRRTGGLPTSFEALEAGRFLRKRYKDPITGGDFQPVFLGQVAAAAPGMPGQTGRGGPAGQQGVPVSPQQGRFSAQPPAQPGRAGFPPGVIPGQGGAGPIVGVVSTSSEESLRLYNGRGRYSEWLFVATAATQQPEAPDDQASPPGRGGRGVNPGPGRRGIPPGLGSGPGRGFPLPLPEIP